MLLTSCHRQETDRLHFSLQLVDLPLNNKKLSADIVIKRAVARALRSRGLPTTVIAKAYQVSDKTVYNWLNPPPHKPCEEWGKRGHAPKLTEEQQREVYEWLLEDTQRRQIDAVSFVWDRWEIEITQQTVGNYLKKFQHQEVDPARLAHITHLNYSMPKHM